MPTDADFDPTDYTGGTSAGSQGDASKGKGKGKGKHKNKGKDKGNVRSRTRSPTMAASPDDRHGCQPK